jgi:SNF2 family DNA or RNA helicase
MQVLNPEIAQSVQGLEFLSSAPEFREKIAPVYYRRRREDVLTELPDLIENIDWCTLSKEEERLYEDAILSGNFADARRVSFNVSDPKDSSKAQRLLEIVEDAEEDGRKVIVFSFFLDTIAKVTKLLGERCLEPINGSVAPSRRQEIIDEFDKAKAGSVLAAQIQSGGTGLNIQSASVVVLCEPQFKPSIENQAISRAYRMGQTRNVLVHRLLCDETVDERVFELLKSKQEIFDAFADESAVGIESLEIDENTFSGIMEQEKKRIEEKASTPPQVITE